ncbi:MAG TPA: hypothetical protein VK445_05290, partial [Dissulfurispiraceae bacterium]|nr:hypothetical protein [Dissulfurispiraceae bacterium]
MKDKLLMLWSRPLVRRVLYSVVIFYVLLGVAGFFIAPSYVKAALLERLSAELGRQLTIEKVSVNPYTLAVDIGPVVVKERDGQAVFLSFDSLYLNLELISIFKG